MMATPRLSLRARLRLGLAALATVIALLCVSAVLSLNRLGSAIATILQENYVSVLACEDMKDALERQDSAAIFAASGRDELARAMLPENRRRFADALDRELHNITLPGEGDLAREVEALIAGYTASVDSMLALPTASRGNFYFHELLPAFTLLEDRIQAIHRMNQENMENADRAAKKLARRTMQGALAISVAALLFMAWFAFWLPRTIVPPLAALSRTAKEIGEGNLDVTIGEPPVIELASLAASMRRMVERLRAYRQSSLGELLAAKDLARATVECMLDPVVVFDHAGNTILVNEAAERAFGLQPGTHDELRTMGIDVPREIAAARDAVAASSDEVLPSSLSEAMRRQGPEGEKYYLVRAAPLAPSGDEKPGAVVVAQDVTRFRRIDELKSDMVATVSHQFKTPLTSLRMATHMLLEASAGTLSEGQREMVVTARDETERLRAMVDELLDLVRIEAEAGALHRAPIEPRVLLGEVADAHRTVAKERDVVLDVQLGEGIGTVSADHERLFIVLANLVSNAVRHTLAGGRVTLRAESEGSVVRLSVTDTGEGIPTADLARIFERSVSIGNVSGRERHGLGLNIAREIVLQHGGELLVTSAPGAGSVFTVVLPATPRPA